MSEEDRSVFELSEMYAFLEDGGAAPLVGAEGFWKELMSGAPRSADVIRVASGDGWLVARYRITEDTPAWEKHPAGDELLFMLSGEMSLIIEQGPKEVTVDLAAGRAFVVPRGTWHRQVVRSPGEYLGATYGKGTEHRPR
ncbi:MAG: cupin domain-containing protein [Vicinamibacteria bacterium]|nr:cupin domain-containing protein [Vicinamibacteria bacterium]